MFLGTKTRTQTTTIAMHDIRHVTQCIVKEAGLIKRYYQNASLADEVKLARDIGLMLLEEWIISIEVELYEPDTRRKVFAYSYRAKADPNTTHQEPGSFKKFRKKARLSFRLIVIENPAKSKAEREAFFKEIGWTYVQPLIESGRGKIERDGGFRANGFTAERWVYSDDHDDKQGGGYQR
jgi:hypothetical protein